MSHEAVSLAVLVVVVVLFVWNYFPVELVALGSGVVLFFTGVVDLNQVFAGFSDPAVVLIAALFVVSEGLDATGVTTWAGQNLVSRSGPSLRRLLVLTMLMAALLTALISLNGAVAALLPMVVIVALRQKHAPSQLLMPLAFAGSAGSLLLLTGSPVNLLISEAAADAGVGSFGFFEFAPIGIPLVLGTLGIAVLLGSRLLPTRGTSQLPRDLSKHARTLVRGYGFEGGVYRLRVRPRSPMIDHSRAVADLAQYPGLKVVSVLANGVGAPTNSGLIAVDDVLVVSGDEELVTRYALDQWLAVVDARSADQAARSIFERNQGAAEVVVPPRSRLIGARVHPGKVLWGGSVVVLAVRRQGRDQAGKETKIAVGDSLLVEGRWDALDEAVAGHDVLVVDSPEQIRRQVVPMGRGSRRALMILAGMVLLLAWGAVPAVLAGLLAAGAMIAARVLTVEQAYDGVGWTTVILVAGMFPLSTAIRISGAGQDVGSLLVHIVGNAGPYGLLIGLFIVTVAFGQLISNTATALVMIPIAVSAAAQMHVSARPVLFSLCVACATSFLTPVATPANMMVSGPAGYRFTDFWRLGIPLVGLFFVVATVWVPLIWRF